LTLEKKSKISLKQWVTTIRRYEYELPRLYEKLEYLKVRSIGYSSPSFEPKFGGRGSSNDYSIDYWLEKIDACEGQIKKRECAIYKLKTLIDTFNPIERDVFEKKYFQNENPKEICRVSNISRSKYYSIVDKLNNMIWVK